MENRVINKEKIYEAYIKKPDGINNENEQSEKLKNIWSVVFVMGYDLRLNDAVRISIDNKTYSECVEIIDSLGFLHI